MRVTSPSAATPQICPHFYDLEACVMHTMKYNRTINQPDTDSGLVLATQLID